MNGYEFETVCAEYLRAHGFRKVQVTKASRDQGADIIARRQKEKYAFQCKYYATPVGNKAVQEVYAAATFYGCDRAVVMTNSTFTSGAKELAESLGVELMPGIEPLRRRFGALDGLMILPVLFLAALLALAAFQPEIPKLPGFLRGDRLAGFGGAFFAAIVLVLAGGLLFFFRLSFWGLLLCTAGACTARLADIPEKWQIGLIAIGVFCAFLNLIRTIAGIPAKLRTRRARRDEAELSEEARDAEACDAESEEPGQDVTEPGEAVDGDMTTGETDDAPAGESDAEDETGDENVDETGEAEDAGENVEDQGKNEAGGTESSGDGITAEVSETFSEGTDKIHRRAVIYELIGIAEKSLLNTDKPDEQERILAVLDDAYKLIQEEYRRR